MRLQMTAWKASDPDPRHRVVRALYFRKNSPDLIVPADANALCDDLATIFVGVNDHQAGHDRLQVKAYNLADAEPRPVIGESTIRTLPTTTPGVREVAVCLSFYADRNLPRRRGRIYMGPFTNAQLLERPPDPLRNAIANLADAFSSLGGVDIDWCVYSRAESLASNSIVFHKVTNAWVDDEWDVQRKRGLEGVTRTQKTVSG